MANLDYVRFFYYAILDLISLGIIKINIGFKIERVINSGLILQEHFPHLYKVMEIDNMYFFQYFQ